MPHSSMRLRRGVLAILAVTAVAVLLPAPVSTAAPGMAGIWVSDSRRDSGFGYTLTLKAKGLPSADYAGTLTFNYPDGRVGSSVRVLANAMGGSLVLTARDGSFDRSGRTLRATVDPRSGAMTFVNCAERLRLVMSWALDSDCVLRLSR